MKEKNIVCSHCRNSIFEHYAVTEGRCWNCHTTIPAVKLGLVA